jgi:hypothetical protein
MELDGLTTLSDIKPATFRWDAVYAWCS